MDIRFMRCASVGEIVRAPRPCICVPWPGIADARLAEPGVLFCPALGDLGNMGVFLLASGVKVLVLLLVLEPKLGTILGGG